MDLSVHLNLMNPIMNQKLHNSIENCNWISVVPNINYNPSLQEKIKIMNLIYNSAFMLSTQLYNRLEDHFTGIITPME